MKKILFILLIGFALNVNAQYFNNYYEPNYMGSGRTTKYIADGHLLAGVHNNDIAVIFTSITGGFGGSFFKNAYHMKYNGDDAVVNGAEALEYSDGTGFAVVGSFSVNNTYGVFFLRLSTSGSVITSSCFNFGSTLKVKAVCESTSDPGDIFVCGDVPSVKVFAMRINQAGSLLWGYVYSTQYGWSPGTGAPSPPNNPQPVEANAIMQSNLQANGIYPLTLAGGIFNKSYLAAIDDWNGLFYGIDPTNGAAGPYTVYINNNTTKKDEIFTGLDESSDGMVVSGYSTNDYTNNPPTVKYNWITLFPQRTDPNWAAYTWSNEYWSPNTGVISTLAGVKWRASTNEYYAIGKEDQSGLYAITLIKVDNTGSPLNGRFYIKNYDYPDVPVDIDLNLNGTANGIGLYSYGYNTDTYNYDMNILKTYFNGVYDCTSSVLLPTKVSKELIYYSGSAFGEEFSQTGISVDNIYSLDYSPLCYAETVNDGDNSFTGIKAISKNTNSITLYPNPISAVEQLNLNLSESNLLVSEIIIYDIMGKIVLQKTNPNFIGKEIKIDLSKTNLIPGIYSLNVKCNSGIISKSFIIK